MRQIAGKGCGGASEIVQYQRVSVLSDSGVNINTNANITVNYN